MAISLLIDLAPALHTGHVMHMWPQHGEKNLSCDPEAASPLSFS